MTTQTLIEDLTERTLQNISDAEQIQQLAYSKLNWKAAPERWSVLECIEHLNLYGDFYLPEIERRIAQSTYSADEKSFRSGLLGDYFAKSMLPGEKLNKMKTFKDKNPLGSQLDKSTLDRFLAQQQKLLELLDSARNVSLSRTKTSISISGWIKLRLGDTFRVVIYHNQRHLVQAFTVLRDYQRQSAQAEDR